MVGFGAQVVMDESIKLIEINNQSASPLPLLSRSLCHNERSQGGMRGGYSRRTISGASEMNDDALSFVNTCVPEGAGHTEVCRKTDR